MTPFQKLLDQHVGGDTLAPITRRLGIVLASWGPGEARLELEVHSTLHNALGTLHGGVYCDLADVGFGCALASEVGSDESFTTVSLQASYLRPVREGRIVATARVIQLGHRAAYLECDVRDGAGELVARLSAHYLIAHRASG